MKIIRTNTGIEIGRMYSKALPQLNQDEEKIQQVLLGIRKPDHLSITPYIIFVVVMLTMLALIFWSK